MANVWDSPSTFSQPFGTPSVPAGLGGNQPNPLVTPPQTYAVANTPAPVQGYFNPNTNYGANQDWFNSDVGQNILQGNQNLAYGYYGNSMGIQNNNNAFNQWFYQQYPKFQQGYGMASAQNPMLTIDQFVKTLPGMGQLQQQFQMQSGRARGENSGQYSPIARWMQR